MARDAIIDEAFSRRRAVTRIAEAAGISTAAVSQWKRIPEKHVALVASITGVAPELLRPDLFAVAADAA